MNLRIKALAAAVPCIALAGGASAHSTVVPIDKEPPPRLIAAPPLPGPLTQHVVYIPYRVENLRILHLGGPAARNVSPRVGHLHITGHLPRGRHKVLIEVVDPEGNVFTKQTVTFRTPGKPARQ